MGHNSIWNRNILFYTTSLCSEQQILRILFKSHSLCKRMNLLIIAEWWPNFSKIFSSKEQMIHDAKIFTNMIPSWRTSYVTYVIITNEMLHSQRTCYSRFCFKKHIFFTLVTKFPWKNVLRAWHQPLPTYVSDFYSGSGHSYA